MGRSLTRVLAAPRLDSKANSKAVNDDRLNAAGVVIVADILGNRRDELLEPFLPSIGTEVRHLGALHGALEK
jgi:hypothetical protein